MPPSLASSLRFLAVPFVVFLVYGIGVAVYSTVDTQVDPSGAATLALIVSVGIGCAVASVIAGSAVAPRARVATAAVIVAVITAAQVLQLPAAGTPARTRALWAGALTFFAGAVALSVVAYRERRLVQRPPIAGQGTGA